MLSLPPEIINEIVSLLKSDDRDLFSFAKTCRRLHHATIPIIFARVPLGYYGLAWEGRNPSRALRTLQLLREPGLAKYAGESRFNPWRWRVRMGWCSFARDADSFSCV